MINYNIRGDKIDVTDAINNYFKEKISRVEKYFDKESNIDAKVLFKVRGREQKIEVTIVTKNLQVRAEESHSDMYAAIDLVIDKIEGQIRKNKNRLKNKKYNDFNFENIIFDKDFKEETNKIIRRKEIELKPMNEDEAILQMNLLGHNFFIFKNSENNEVNVLYKRKDEKYGLINTK